MILTLFIFGAILAGVGALNGLGTTGSWAHELAFGFMGLVGLAGMVAAILLRAKGIH